jgi:hypothetical protein
MWNWVYASNIYCVLTLILFGRQRGCCCGDFLRFCARFVFGALSRNHVRRTFVVSLSKVAHVPWMCHGKAIYIAITCILCKMWDSSSLPPYHIIFLIMQPIEINSKPKSHNHPWV